jgi:NADH dehydrogenase
VHASLKHLGAQLLPPQPLDITQSSTLGPAFADADVVISLVGILTGTEKQFVELQQKGGENVAKAAKEAGVGRVLMVSALGADVNGITP